MDTQTLRGVFFRGDDNTKVLSLVSTQAGSPPPNIREGLIVRVCNYGCDQGVTFRVSRVRPIGKQTIELCLVAATPQDARREEHWLRPRQDADWQSFRLTVDSTDMVFERTAVGFYKAA